MLWGPDQGGSNGATERQAGSKHSWKVEWTESMGGVCVMSGCERQESRVMREVLLQAPLSFLHVPQPGVLLHPLALDQAVPSVASHL